MTWPPSASIRSAADITSITMKGGTSLRVEAESSSIARCLNVVSCMLLNLLFDPTGGPWEPGPQRPRLAVFGRLLGHIPSPAKGQSPTMPMLLDLAPRKRLSGLTAVTVAAALVLAPMAPLRAQQGGGPPILRDTEAEALLREYTRPVLRAAGLEKQNIQMVIINDSTFNAFVADGRRIFVNYGAIMQSEPPNQLTGVRAHETGHLAGGHLAHLREQLARAQTQMIIAMLLGVGAIVAGASKGTSGAGLSDAGAAAVAGPGEMIRRSLLSYQRQQEENADRAGVKFLTATG